MFNFDISRVTFEDSFTVIEYSAELNKESLYFYVPKEWVADKHPEADGATIALEFATVKDILLGNPCSACISPIELLDDGDMCDYDWSDISLEHDAILQLVGLAATELQKNRRPLLDWSDKYMEWKKAVK